MEAGRRLAERGTLSQPDDVVFLRLEELGPALATPPTFDVANVVAARKDDYAHHQALSPPPVVVGRFNPDACQPAAADARPRTLQGLPVSRGLVSILDR